MVQCPECGKNVEADFGMTTCASCGAVFMVEIDGSVGSQSPEYEQNESQIYENHESENPDYIENLNESVISDEGLDAPSVEPEVSPEVEQNAAEEEGEYNEDFFEPTLDDKNDPLEVQRFDQASASELSDGEFLYDVTVKGLDSVDLKKDVLAALADKRFSLVKEEMRKNIRQGELLLSDLNPVRAMLVVLKLQEFDVEVEWRQKHFTQLGQGGDEGDE
jgi:hypothetical protein